MDRARQAAAAATGRRRGIIAKVAIRRRAQRASKTAGERSVNDSVDDSVEKMASTVEKIMSRAAYLRRRDVGDIRRIRHQSRGRRRSEKSAMKNVAVTIG